MNIFKKEIHSFKLERLRKRNEEFSERAETAEFQVASINQEYRKLLQQRDVSSFLLKECIIKKDREITISIYYISLDCRMN